MNISRTVFEKYQCDKVMRKYGNAGDYSRGRKKAVAVTRREPVRIKCPETDSECPNTDSFGEDVHCSNNSISLPH
jgi:hypothetical protein